MADFTTIKLPVVSLQAAAQAVELPEWIRKMNAHLRTTGSYRSEDVRKVLGDRQKGIELGSQVSLSSLFQKNP